MMRVQLLSAYAAAACAAQQSIQKVGKVRERLS